MADTELDIQIKTLAETHGADAVREALDGITGSTKKASQASDEHKHKTRELENEHRLLHTTMHKLTEESPIFGAALRIALSPSVAPLIAAAVALELVRKSLKSFETGEAKDATEAAQELTKAFTDSITGAQKLGDTVRDANAKAVEEFINLANSQSGSQKATDLAIQSIKSQEEAIKKLMEANMKLELSQEKTKEGQEAIRRRYGVGEEKLSLDAQRRILDEKEAQLTTALGRAPGLTARVGAAGAAITDEAFQKQKESATTDLERSKKQLEAANKALTGAQGFSVFGADEESARKAKGQAEQTFRFNEERVTALNREEAERKRNFDRAQRAEAENTRIIQERQVEVEQGRKELGLKQAVTGVTGPMGELGAAQTQFTEAFKNIQKAGERIDPIGFITATAQLAILPAKMADLNKAINSGMNAVDKAISDIQNTVNAMKVRQDNNSTRTLPGSG